jgi:uncharacterized protein with HEPN domain
MARRVDVVLMEIISTITEVEVAVSGQGKADFRNAWLHQRAVERAIEIISEAVRHLPDGLLTAEPDIAWNDIRGIGNVIRHEYHRVESDIVWSVVQDELPVLKRAAERMPERLRSS